MNVKKKPPNFKIGINSIIFLKVHLVYCIYVSKQRLVMIDIYIFNICLLYQMIKWYFYTASINRCLYAIIPPVVAKVIAFYMLTETCLYESIPGARYRVNVFLSTLIIHWNVKCNLHFHFFSKADSFLVICKLS